MTITEKFLLDKYILPITLKGVGKGKNRLDYITKNGWYNEFLEYLNIKN